MSRRRRPRGRPAAKAAGRKEVAPERAPRVELSIDDLDHAGRGVGRAGGKVAFVPGAVPGDRVRARITRPGRRADEAALEAVLEASPGRVEPFCPVFGRCGGCTLQHLDTTAQRRQREALLARELARATGGEPDTWLESLAGPERGYRVRGRLGVGRDRAGAVTLGFRERGGHGIVDTDACEITHPLIGRQLPAIRAAVAGLARPRSVGAVEFAVGEAGGAIALRARESGRSLPADETDRERLRALQEATGLGVGCLAAGDETARSVVDGEPLELRYALPAEGVELAFGVTDFVQANPVVNRALVSRAMDWLGPSGEAPVLDLFCGIGNFSLAAARRGARVLGLEGSPELVTRATRNARLNGLESRARFECADLRGPDWTRYLTGEPGTRVLLDPPREGAREAVQALTACRPARVVYVSCDPATLARDVGELVGKGGYRLRAAGLADMFPHTGHVESIVVLDRQGT